MRWQLQQAKQRFSEMVRQAQTDGPQVVTRHGLLAATAKARGWTLVTRNVRDVAPTGARVLDPFAS